MDDVSLNALVYKILVSASVVILMVVIVYSVYKHLGGAA